MYEVYDEFFFRGSDPVFRGSDPVFGSEEEAIHALVADEKLSVTFGDQKNSCFWRGIPHTGFAFHALCTRYMMNSS
jgi:hypothetical protein